MVREKLSTSEGTLNCGGREATDHIYQSYSGASTNKIRMEYKLTYL